MTPQDVARFWSHVDVRGPEDCWPWRDAKTRKGYGRFYVGGRMVTASRLSLELTSGPLGAEEARHRCDNPPCCNPAHLVPGSHAENMADMARRERSPHTKLTAADVTVIRERRAAGDPVTVLAAEFGVTPSNVSQIARRVTWKHVGAAA